MFAEFIQARLTEDGEMKTFGKVALKLDTIKGYYQCVDKFDVASLKASTIITEGGQQWCVALSYNEIKSLLEDNNFKQ